MKRLLSTNNVLIVLTLALACAAYIIRITKPAKPLSAPDDASTYRLGTWRLAPFDDLHRSMIWLSIILIEHRDISRELLLLRTPGWKRTGPHAVRTREQALHLINTLHAQAKANMAQFPELARSFSDDLSSRELGGSLGGMRATDIPARLLDALQATGRGNLSDVLEAEDGFYLVHWREPPEHQRIAGQRLVIKYQDAIQTPSFDHSRTRAEAISLANELLASNAEVSFDELILNNSEHPDRVRLGHIGTWSTHEPTFLGLEIEVLSNLKLNQVSPPIDTPNGIAILRRVEADANPGAYATTSLSLRYDPYAPESATNSRSAVLAIARRVASQLQLEPAEFDTISRSMGYISERNEWHEYREDAALEHALSNLSIGSVSAPVDTLWAFTVARRDAPSATVEDQTAVLDLPAPKSAAIDQIVEHSDSGTLIEQIDRLKTELPQANVLEGAALSTATELLTAAQLELRRATTSSERQKIRLNLERGMNDRLSDINARRLAWFIDAWSSRQVLAQSQGASH